MEGHGRRVLTHIGSRLRDKAEAEDVFQEVLAEFLEAHDVGLVIESLGAWLVQVAQNKIIDRFRKKKTETNYQTSMITEAKADSGDAGVELHAPLIAGPEEEWTRSWLREEIADALDLLPPEQRQVFVMHELEGKSFEEIAEELDTPLSTLLSRKRYAVLFLREHLKEIYDELE